MKQFCICCHKKEELCPGGLCESCDQDWTHSGLLLEEYVTWKTKKSYAQAFKDARAGGDLTTIKQVNFREDPLWKLKMHDNSTLHRVEVYVGNDHIGHLPVTDKYLKYFVGEPNG